MAPFTTATLPLQSCRMLASWLRLPGRRAKPVNRNRSRLRTAIETNPATGAAFPGVPRRMHTVGAQLWSQLQAFGRARIDTKPAALALIHVDQNVSPSLCRHIHLVTALAKTCGR